MSNYNRGRIIVKVVIVVVIIIAVILGIMGILIYSAFNKYNELENVANEIEENVENSLQEEEETEDVIDEPFIGKWGLYNDEEEEEGNYFIFNADGTFEWANSSSGVIVGDYTYEEGVTTASGEKRYVNNDYRFFTLTWTPTEVVKNDGTVVTDNLNQLEYAIGVNHNYEMVAQNLSSKNIYNLKKMDDETEEITNNNNSNGNNDNNNDNNNNENNDNNNEEDSSQIDY